MRAKRRITAVVSLLSAAVLVTVAACGGSSPTSHTKVGKLNPDKKVTITWWHGQTADAADVLQGLANDYMKEHPNVTIKAASGASTTDQLLQKLQAGFASNTYPDISYAFGNWASELASSQRTLDITKLVDAPDSGWNEFAPAARATATVDGKVIGMPAIVDDLALIYNKKLFDQAGLDYPTNDWTWQDFRTAAKKLTNPAKKQFGTAYPVDGSEDTVWRLWPQLWQNGGDVIKDGKPAFNSQAGVDALQYWRELADDDHSVYLDQNGQKYLPSFFAGNIGMIVSGPWTLYSMKQQKTPYGISFLPGTNGNHQTIAGPDLWVLFDHDNAQRAAASYDFIKWLTAPKQDVRFNVKYGHLPLRTSATSTPQYQQFLKDYPGAQVFFENMKNATTPRPTVNGYNDLSRDVGTAISTVLLENKDPKAELDKAAQAAAVALK